MKNIREGYIETKIGKIPKEWIVDKLGNRAYIKARIGWRGLSSDEYTDEGPYLVAGKHIKGSKILWNECDHISIERYNESSEIMLKEKDIIMTKDGTIGRVGFIDKLKEKATINGTMMLIRPNEDMFYSKFLYYYFQGENFKKIINEKISGSSIPHIFQRDMVNLEVPIPSIDEQKKIALVLSTVDEQIDNVNELIKKNNELKKGLMQQLLTKGIGHTKFKMTEFGEIPEEWEVKKFKDITEILRCGVASTPTYVENGIPFLSAQNVSNEKLSLHKYNFISEEYHKQLTKNDKPQKNDILYSRVGANYGIAAIVDVDFEFSVYVSLTLIRLKDKYSSNFYKYLLNSTMVRKQADIGVFQGGGVPNLNVKVVEKFNVVVPSKDEQIKIASILSKVDEKIEEYENKKQKLEGLKKGLMQQLLIGNIRVNN